MIFNMEQKTYKQMKISPIKNPNYERKETPEQLCNLINRLPIVVYCSDDYVIGQTVTGTAKIIDDFICGDIVSFHTDLSKFEWCNAGIIIDPYKRIVRYTGVEYKLKEEQND